MIATLVPLLLVLAALIGYSLLLLAVYSGRAYRNGLAEGRRQAAAHVPSNVRVLGARRGWSA